jgi:hypothetical protein
MALAPLPSKTLSPAATKRASQLRRRLGVVAGLFIVLKISLIGFVTYELSVQVMITDAAALWYRAATISLLVLTLAAYVWLDAIWGLLTKVVGRRRTILTYYWWSILPIFAVTLICTYFASKYQDQGRVEDLVAGVSAVGIMYTLLAVALVGM